MKTDLGYFFNDAGIEEERSYTLRGVPGVILTIRMRHSGDNRLYGELAIDYATPPGEGFREAGALQFIKQELAVSKCREISPGIWRVKNYELLLSLHDQIKHDLKYHETKISSSSKEHFAEILTYHPAEMHNQNYYLEIDGSMISASKNIFLIHLYPSGKNKLQIFCRCETARKPESAAAESENLYSWILSSSRVTIGRKNDTSFVVADLNEYRKILEKMRVNLSALRFLYTEILF